MSLTHRLFNDAFHDMQRAMTALEQPFINTSRLLSNQTGSMLRYPATDISETDDAYELHAELPGYDKKDINIELADDGRTLVLSGKKEQKKDKESQELTTKKDEDSQVAKRNESPQWWVNERVVGSFTRSFSFPNQLKADSIKASYDNGILKVTVPKVKETKSKQIQIE
ncbi:HSP20-like chaperone [Helicostylum pulchrum]|nr:HSP20-like chaperone [Helicostylum pulchrum]